MYHIYIGCFYISLKKYVVTWLYIKGADGMSFIEIYHKQLHWSVFTLKNKKVALLSLNYDHLKADYFIYLFIYIILVL